MIKFCTYGGLLKEYLDKADEIKILHPKYDVLLNDYCVNYPNKTFILCWTNNPEEVTLPEIKQLQSIYPGVRFVIALDNLSWYPKLNEMNIQWFYNYPIIDFYTLNGLIGAGAAMAIVGPPLIFNMDRLHKLPIEIRIRPNVAYYDGEVPHMDGIHGGWIRPEDIDLYDPCTIEFYGNTQSQQEVLFKIYQSDKEWAGSLNMLISGFGVSLDNRALPDEFGEKRLNCKQRCEEDNSCHYCQSAIRFAQTIERKANEIQEK